jgi:hypothetical protein
VLDRATQFPTRNNNSMAMDLWRRLAFLGTGGVVDLRSDSERIDDYAKKLAHQRQEQSQTGTSPGD